MDQIKVIFKKVKNDNQEGIIDNRYWKSSETIDMKGHSYTHLPHDYETKNEYVTIVKSYDKDGKESQIEYRKWKP